MQLMLQFPLLLFILTEQLGTQKTQLVALLVKCSDVLDQFLQIRLSG